MPLDYGNNYATIELDVDVETYTTTNYNLELEVGNENPIRDDENALFNIYLEQGEFITDNMKHVRTMSKEGFKDIKEITKEFMVGK
jgi:hypothetical protein